MTPAVESSPSYHDRHHQIPPSPPSPLPGVLIAQQPSPVSWRAAAVSSSNPLGDDRFGAMFESAEFEVDPESEEYARAHPTSVIANKMVSERLSTPLAGAWDAPSSSRGGVDTAAGAVGATTAVSCPRKCLITRCCQHVISWCRKEWLTEKP